MEFTKKAPNLKKGMNRLSHSLKERGRRFFAVLLCASMVISGFPGSFFQAFASDDDDEDYVFELEGDSLYEALCTAVSEGTTLDSELAFAGEYAEEYAGLFEPDGTLYELKEFDYEKDSERDKKIALRVFVRIKGDIPLDENYRFDGEEEILFLITNRSDEEVSTTICVDGRETDVITVLPASMIEVEDEVAGPGAVEAITDDDLEEEAETDTVVSRSFSGGSPSGGGSSSGTGSGTVKDNADVEEDSDKDAEKASENSEKVSSEGEEASDEANNGIHRGHSSGRDSSAEKDEDNQNDDKAESDKDSSSDSGEDKADGGKEKSDDGSDSRDKADGKDDGGEKVHERDNSSEGHDRTDDSERSGNRSHDRNRSDKGSSESSKDASDHDTASISVHKTGLLAASIEIEEDGETEAADAGEDDYEDSVVTVEETGETAEEIVYDSEESEIEIKPATPSNASPSDADHAINGMVYNPVRLANRGATAFVTTAEDLELTRYYGINALTAYDQIYTYMDSLLERSTELEEGDIEDAIDLWDELMDAWEAIYEAEDNEALDLSDSEYERLDEITEEIYQNVLAAGYDPYAISDLALPENEVEVTGSITVTGGSGTWSQSSSNGGEVQISGNTITGWAPGTVTLTRGNTSVDITVRSTVRVLVYVSTADMSEKMMELLGIDRTTIDVYGFFPSGVVYLDANYLIDNNLRETAMVYDQALILTEAQWEEVRQDMYAMDTSAGVFATGYTGNAGNNVPNYLEDAADYLGNGSSSGGTALFHTGGYQGYSSDFDDALFHMDLLFHTNTVKYVYGNNGITGEKAQDGSTAIEEETYIQGVTIDEMNPEFIVPDGYVFEGYYLDPDFENNWDSNTRLYEDLTIYIKLEKGETITVDKVDADNKEHHLSGAQFLLCKVAEEELYDEEGNPTGQTDYFTYYYDFNEFTGWIGDREQATPYTTTGEEGEFEMILAPCTDDTFYYYLEEVSAPDGYKLSNYIIEFTITYDGDTAVVTIISDDNSVAYVESDTSIYIVNEPYTVNVFKYTDGTDDDGETIKVPLAGAEFILSKTVTEEEATDELPAGTYYGIFEETTVTIDDGTETVYTFTEWVTDKESATHLASGEDGYTYTIEDLPIGDYTLEEIKAPDGYNLLTEGISFILNEDGSITLSGNSEFASIDNDEDNTICVKNIPGAELPQTGGAGTLPFHMLGAFLSGSALCLLFLTLRRRRRWVES